MSNTTSHIHNIKERNKKLSVFFSKHLFLKKTNTYNKLIFELAYYFLESKFGKNQDIIDMHTIGDYSILFWRWWKQEFYRVDNLIYNMLLSGQINKINLRAYIRIHIDLSANIDKIIYTKPNQKNVKQETK